MPVLAGRGSNLAKHTYLSKINLAKGGPDFASFAKFGDKIANLATLFCYDFVDETKPVSVAVPLSKLPPAPNGPEWAMAMGQSQAVN